MPIASHVLASSYPSGMNSTAQEKFHAAPFIREIGRGKKGARDLSREDARRLYAAMLDGEVSDLELGALLIGMRIKGESVAEIAGFSVVAITFLQLPAAIHGGRLARADLLVLLGKPLDFTLRFGAAPALAPDCRFAIVDPDPALLAKAEHYDPNAWQRYAPARN